VKVVLLYLDGYARVEDFAFFPGGYIAADPVLRADGSVSLTYFDLMGTRDFPCEGTFVYKQRAKC
jgi:hypothetical protein